MKQYLLHIFYLLIIGFLLLKANLKAKEFNQVEEKAEMYQTQARRIANKAEELAARATREQALALSLKKKLEECQGK